MPVFNVAQGQQLARPIDARYEGKAIRNELEAQRINNELGQKELDTYDARESRAQQQHAQEVAQAQQERVEAFFNYSTAFAENDDREGATQLAQKIFPEMFSGDGDSEISDEEWAEFKKISSAFKKNTTPNQTEWERLLDDGLKKGWLDEKEAENLRKSRLEKGVKTSPAVNVDIGQGDKFYEQFSKEQANRLIEMGKKAESAKSQISSLDLFESALDQGAQTGTLQPALVYIKGALSDLGFDLDDDLPLQEQIQSLEVSGALGRISETKGPISDKEMALFIRSVPNLAKSEEGNRIMIDFLRWKSEVAIDQYKVAKNAKDPDAVLDMDMQMPQELRERIEAAAKKKEEPEKITVEVGGETYTVNRRKAG